ncbi:B3 domain-containing protein isoform X1 [Prunus yedoensis var. nudiflora]|uniref:B3 domain-containing protein isoform X1 n=1 Tax=Prunus yedoensis var. nudiflora TaxID=2094558 RepID=A0A314UEG7_PRUYE|nr:B3 domain-containing protein isoform X1 [Prunus yedoensis var. nudiflora]
MISKKLAKAEGLKSARNVKLRYPNGRLWLVKLVICPKSSCKRVEFTTGWGECCQANQMLVRDTMVFEFVKQVQCNFIFSEQYSERQEMSCGT